MGGWESQGGAAAAPRAATLLEEAILLEVLAPLVEVAARPQEAAPVLGS